MLVIWTLVTLAQKQMFLGKRVLLPQRQKRCERTRRVEAQTKNGKSGSSVNNNTSSFIGGDREPFRYKRSLMAEWRQRDRAISDNGAGCISDRNRKRNRGCAGVH